MLKIFSFSKKQSKRKQDRKKFPKFSFLMLSLAFDILQQVFAPFQSLVFFTRPQKNRIVCINLHIFSIIQSENIFVEIYQIRKDFKERVRSAKLTTLLIIENQKKIFLLLQMSIKQNRNSFPLHNAKPKNSELRKSPIIVVYCNFRANVLHFWRN